jgi:hypothetical protein
MVCRINVLRCLMPPPRASNTSPQILTSGFFLPLRRLLRLEKCALSAGSNGPASRIVGGWGTNDRRKRGLRRARIGLPGWQVAVGTTI